VHLRPATPTERRVEPAAQSGAIHAIVVTDVRVAHQHERALLHLDRVGPATFMPARGERPAMPSGLLWFGDKDTQQRPTPATSAPGGRRIGRLDELPGDPWRRDRRRD
jgi:hypothetical protein